MKSVASVGDGASVASLSPNVMPKAPTADAAENAAADGTDDDRTVKMKRPALKKPAAVTPPPTAPAAAPVPPRPQFNPAGIGGAKMNPARPGGPLGQPAPLGQGGPLGQPGMPGQPAPAAPEAAEIPKPVAGAASPSLFYMLMAIFSLIFLLGTAVLTTAHYLNFVHNIEVSIPGVPFRK